MSKEMLARFRGRYQIAPQMEVYDHLGNDPLPYSMKRAAPADFSSPVCNTDRYGFRVSIGAGGKKITVADLQAFEKVAIVVGGSTVFGVGASSDLHTIPSLLNQEIGRLPWINLGGRAYNSIQELISLLMFVPVEKIACVVMFSGINACYLPLLENFTDANVASFFNQSEYWAGTKLAARAKYRFHQFPAMQDILRSLSGKPRIQVPASPSLQEKMEAERMEAGIERSLRDLRAMRAISKGMGFPLFYFFQPFAGAVEKKRSPEETALFSILDDIPGAWRVLPRLREVAPEFIVAHKEFCRESSIPFFDTGSEFTDDGWLFVDRVHLTDLGNRRAAGLIRRELGLAGIF